MTSTNMNPAYISSDLQDLMRRASPVESKGYSEEQGDVEKEKIYEQIKSAAPFMDVGFSQGEGQLSPSEKMILLYLMSVTSAEAPLRAAGLVYAKDRLRIARQRWRGGYSGNPFGEPIARDIDEKDARLAHEYKEAKGELALKEKWQEIWRAKAALLPGECKNMLVNAQFDENLTMQFEPTAANKCCAETMHEMRLGHWFGDEFVLYHKIDLGFIEFLKTTRGAWTAETGEI